MALLLTTTADDGFPPFMITLLLSMHCIFNSAQLFFTFHFLLFHGNLLDHDTSTHGEPPGSRTWSYAGPEPARPPAELKRVTSRSVEASLQHCDSIVATYWTPSTNIPFGTFSTTRERRGAWILAHRLAPELHESSARSWSPKPVSWEMGNQPPSWAPL